MANQVTTLRMEQKFKQTPAGEIPVDWESVRLGDLCDLITKGTTPTTYGFQFTNSGVHFIKVENINDTGKFLLKNMLCISENTHQALKRSVLQENDILFSIAGALGRSAIVSADMIPANTNQALAIIRLKKSEVDFRYVRYFLSSDFTKGQIGGMGTQGAQSNLSLAQVGDIPIPIPPKQEQTKIAEILSSVDDAIEKITTVRGKISALSSDLRLRLVYQGLGYKKLKESEIGRIPDRWAVVPLEQIATIERGKFQHRPRNEPRFYGGKYPFIQTGEVTNAGGRIRSYIQTLNEEGLAISKLFPKGTILITIAANIGETAIADFEVAFPDSIIGIVAGDRTDNRFLEYYLRTRKAHLNSLAPQSAQKNINLETLRPYPVPLPPKEEQIQIADILDVVHAETWQTNKILQHWNHLKTGLLQVLLAGKRRVAGI